MKRNRLTIPFLSTLLFLLSAGSVLAQERSREFDTFTLGITTFKDFNGGGFQQNWEPQIGAEVYFRAPFYLGNFQTGITYSAYGSLINGNPDFKLFSFYLQWDYEIKIIPQVAFSVGGRTGLSEMKFAENEIVTDTNLLSETELTAGIVSQLSFLLPKGWVINITGNYITLFTYPRMNIFFLGAGIGKSFSTPDWLREFLK